MSMNAEASDASKQLLQTHVPVMWLQPVPETHFNSGFVQNQDTITHLQYYLSCLAGIN